MNPHAHAFRRLSAAALVAAAGLAATVDAAAQKAPAGSPSTAALAIPPAEVAALMENFSEQRAVFTQRGGEKLYQAICQGCHMPRGEGARGVGFYPSLAANPKLAASAYPVTVVLNGLHGMPGFARRLSDEQVADVVNHVRTHFGNRFTDPVRPEDVRAYRVAP